MISDLCSSPIETFVYTEPFFLTNFADNIAVTERLAATLQEEYPDFLPPVTNTFEILAAFTIFHITKQKNKGKWKVLKTVELGFDLFEALYMTEEGRLYAKELESKGVKLVLWSGDDGGYSDSEF
ncbi:hypothetical protein BT69DRAFT_1276653, partial [Atractiella rhizophila]